MRKRKGGPRSHCPVNYSLEAFGDPWALLVLRDIVFRGKRTYGEFLRAEEGWATNILASRLENLVSVGILRRDPDESDRRRDIYSLTDKGLDLIPVILQMVLWSAKYDADSEARRIPRLIEAIRSDHRATFEEVRERVRSGEGIVKYYVE